MKILVTRVSKGKVKVGKEIKASIGRGIVLFVGLETTDSESNLLAAVKKIINMRIFEDKHGKLSQSIQEKEYPVLCIPNFTLCGSTEKGRRPSFQKAMEPTQAKKMFDKFIILLQNTTKYVQSGVFGAHMDISLEIDGPVNINLQT